MTIMTGPVTGRPIRNLRVQREIRAALATVDPRMVEVIRRKHNARWSPQQLVAAEAGQWFRPVGRPLADPLAGLPADLAEYLRAA